MKLGLFNTSMACHPSDHYWDYYPGALSVSQVTATHLKIGHPQILSMGAKFSNVLETWLHDRVPG